MKIEDFKNAVEIIAQSNSTLVAFNTPITDSYSNVYQILIKRSNASLIKILIENSYCLSMTKKGLSIDKY